MNLFDNDFKLTIFKDNIDILNYKSIEHISSDKIIVDADRMVIISGIDLTLKCMMDDEILINGKIKKVELR